MTQKSIVLTAFFSAFFLALPAAAGEFRVEVISKGFQHDFWKQVRLGCMEAGREFDAAVNFAGPESESDIAVQAAQIAEAVEKRPSALCIAALSPDAVLEHVFKAADLGIPVITFDSDIGDAAGDDVRAFVATDNRVAGAGAADHMHEQLRDRIAAASGPVRIGVFSQDTISQSIGDRTFGFIERMAQLCGPGNVSVEGHLLYENPVPGAAVVLDVAIPRKTVDADMDEAVLAVLRKPDLAGAYGSNEFAAKSMIAVNRKLNVLGPDRAVGIGFDSGAMQIQAVRDRVFHGSITQNPFQIGFLTIKTAVEAARGLPVHNVAVPFHFYTADNMDIPEIAACLYE